MIKMIIRVFNSQKMIFDRVDLSYDKMKKEYIDYFGVDYRGKYIDIDDKKSNEIYSGDIVYYDNKCYYIHEDNSGQLSMFCFNMVLLNQYILDRFDSLVTDDTRKNSIPFDKDILEKSIVITNKYEITDKFEISERIYEQKNDKNSNNTSFQNDIKYIEYNISDYIKDIKKDDLDINLCVNIEYELLDIVYKKRNLVFIFKSINTGSKNYPIHKKLKFKLVPMTSEYFFSDKKYSVRINKIIQCEDEEFFLFGLE